MVIQELEERIKRLETGMNQMIRQGIVTQVFPEKGRVKVRLPDSDQMETAELPVVFAKTLENKAYDMPDVGEHVVCIFLPNGLEQGVVLGAVYSGQDPVPVNHVDKTHYRFKDGSFMEYDRGTHELNIDIKGGITINAATQIRMSAPRIDLN